MGLLFRRTWQRKPFLFSLSTSLDQIARTTCPHRSWFYMKPTTSIINEAIYFSDIQTLPTSTHIFRGASHTCYKFCPPLLHFKLTDKVVQNNNASCFDLYHRSCKALIEEGGMCKTEEIWILYQQLQKPGSSEGKRNVSCLQRHMQISREAHSTCWISKCMKTGTERERDCLVRSWPCYRHISKDLLFLNFQPWFCWFPAIWLLSTIFQSKFNLELKVQGN